jgi:dTDP-4-amino-4,6-dideoxygalactose transaminase
MINRKKAGLFLDFATFSFYPSKNIGSFRHAGAVIFEFKDYYKQARRIVNH